MCYMSGGGGENTQQCLYIYTEKWQADKLHGCQNISAYTEIKHKLLWEKQ